MYCDVGSFLLFFVCRLEERLAQRRARLAEKQQATQALGQTSAKEKEKIEKEVENEKNKIKQVRHVM